MGWREGRRGIQAWAHPELGTQEAQSRERPSDPPAVTQQERREQEAEEVLRDHRARLQQHRMRGTLESRAKKLGIQLSRGWGNALMSAQAQRSLPWPPFPSPLLTSPFLSSPPLPSPL